MTAHVPVLLNEVIRILDPRPGEFFIDGTAGSGGHSRAILEKVGPPAGGGKLLAIDWEKTGENYADLPEILKQKELGKADGLLLDLGFSSEQLSSGKGFSFSKDEPLVMTYDPTGRPAYQIIRELNENELTEIIRTYGEERYARKIAQAIKTAERKKLITTSGQLTDVIVAAVPKNYERGRLHPATRTFMALRIYVNKELENLEKLLKELPEVLKSGGRAAIISFHSLEDRLVKNYFRDYAQAGQLQILTKKPIVAGQEEILQNPRSRSAKLRAIKMT